MLLVLAYKIFILTLYGNVIYRSILSLIAENLIQHSVQYLNQEVDIMVIVMNYW